MITETTVNIRNLIAGMVERVKCWCRIARIRVAIPVNLKNDSPCKEGTMRKLLLAFVCAVVATSLFCKNAQAEAYVHDGFFLRLAPGFGWNSTSSDTGGNTEKLSGTSGLFNFAIGGAVAQDLILQLDVSGVSTSNPKVTGQTANVTDSTTSLVGIGMTSYFPSNYYITGAVGMAQSSKKVNGAKHETDNGYGANVMLGKEWWVSDDWGIGIAGQFLYTVCPEKTSSGTKPDVKSMSYGILFSATYN